MKKSVFILCCFLSVSVLAQHKAKSLSYRDNNFSCKYHVVDGMLYGDYVSYFRNGKKSAEGFFYNNNRFGTWKLYDSLGNQVAERKYANNFVMETVMPAPPSEEPAHLLSQPAYQFVRDSITHRYNDFVLKERMVIESKRIWRNIYSPGNALLFDHKLLEKTFYQAVSKGMSVFSPANDEFLTVLDSFSAADSSKYRVVAWKIKEDWFFDNERFMAENRIIGLCPRAVRPAAPKDTLDLCWIYFPEFRQYLVNASVKGDTDDVRNLDDIFVLRHFVSSVYKESNVNNRNISDYAKSSSAVQRESQRIELSLIEREHDLWRKFTGH